MGKRDQVLVKAPTDDLRMLIARVSFYLVYFVLMCPAMKVNHSQRMSERPLTPWVIAESSGKIIVGHCDCMAGLGETCSHVSALLWAVESGIRLRESMTVTQKKAYWIIPNNVKEVPYAPVKQIKFIGKKKSRSMSLSPSVSPSHSTSSHSPSPSPSHSPSPSPAHSRAPSSLSSSPPSIEPANVLSLQTNSPNSSHLLLPPSDFFQLSDFFLIQLSDFFASLASLSEKPAILSIVEPYSSSYIPNSLGEDLPMCLLSLLKPEYLTYSYGELLVLAKQCKISVTPEEIEAAECKTRSQSKSQLWFRMRSGRITASNFKTVCHTNEASPSLSVVMSICHPELNKFTSAATDWGLEHEKIVRDQHQCLSNSRHSEFMV